MISISTTCRMLVGVRTQILLIVSPSEDIFEVSDLIRMGHFSEKRSQRWRTAALTLIPGVMRHIGCCRQGSPWPILICKRTWDFLRKVKSKASATGLFLSREVIISWALQIPLTRESWNPIKLPLLGESSLYFHSHSEISTSNFIWFCFRHIQTLLNLFQIPLAEWHLEDEAGVTSAMLHEI